jgi:PKD repeat protein
VTLTSVTTGCDSIAELVLTVNPTYAVTVNAQICQGQSYWAGGALQTTAGIYIDNLVSSNGCDSVITTNLTVVPAIFTNLFVDICQGDSIFAGGAWHTAAGTYYDTLLSSGGCDSIIITNLIINPILYSTTQSMLCDNQLPYTWNGQTYTAAGIYSVTLTTLTTGCDSIAELVLTVNPTVYSSTPITICDDQLPYTWNGQTYTAAGIYSVTLTTLTTGCDSIAELVLTVNPTVNSTTQSMLCDNQLPYTWNGQTYAAAGIYSVTLTSVTTGCDSIAELVLTVNPTVYSTPQSICDNQLPYTWNGQTYTAAGIYSVTLTTLTTGCDSIAELVLTVNPTVNSTTQSMLCDNQLPYTWNGQTYTAAGTYSVTLTSIVTGCDSIAELVLTVNPTVYSTTQSMLCDSQLPYTWNGQTYTAAGTYSVTLTTLGTGCDSIAELVLTVNPTVNSTTQSMLCDNQLPYTWNGQTYTAAGTYSVTLTIRNDGL